MTAPARISYTAASMTIASAIVSLRTAGPRACLVTPSIHDHLLTGLGRVKDLLDEIEGRRQAREVEKRT